MASREPMAEVFAAEGGWAYNCHVCGEIWYSDDHPEAMAMIDAHLGWHKAKALRWPPTASL